MAKKEANFDQFIYKLLNDAQIEYSVQGSEILSINNALKAASKNQKGNDGYPEFVAVVGDFIILGENKADKSKLKLDNQDGQLSMSVKATQDYALNGAFWYSKKIIEQTDYKKIFAIGSAGDKKHHIIQPMFVTYDESGELAYEILKEVSTFENFSKNNIEDYYKRAVLKEITEAEKEIKEILKHAEKLHEDLRSYGALGDTEKPIVVSAILLALDEDKDISKQLNCDDIETDGEKLYNAIEKRLKRARVTPDTKIQQIMSQFSLIKNRPMLNNKNDILDGSPLKWFTNYINKYIYKALTGNSPEDYLGRFYGEFISYSGGDGQTLGVVLTPRHITELFCDLVNLQPDDVVFDPCCGTGGFLISAMANMLNRAEERQKDYVKSAQIHGIELREDMFAIATTNMILRGDGKSNIRCANFLTEEAEELQLRDIVANNKNKQVAISVGLMNPPYSQAKMIQLGIYPSLVL